MSRYFLDANIILDLIDKDRNSVEETKKLIESLLINDEQLFTSCDIFTTVYYVSSKRENYKKVILQLEKILTFVEVIPIDITIITDSIAISKQEDEKDLEDILQYVCALRNSCTTIITNDKNFYSKDLEVMSVSKLLDQY